MAGGAPDLSPYRPLRWEPRKEAWSKYTLYGGEVRVWMREVPVRFIAPPPNPTGATVQVMSQMVAGAIWPDKYRSKPTPEVTPGAMKSAEREVTFDPVEEPWSEYIIFDLDPGKNEPKLIRFRATAVRIGILDKMFNNFGDPVLGIRTQTNLTAPMELPLEQTP